MSSLSATDDYLSLLLSLPHLDPITVLSVFFLTLARILPILVLAPFLGAKNVPTLIRMMFGISLVAIFLPQNLLSIHQEIPYGMAFIGFLLKELLIGTVLGFFASVPFFFAQMSGSLIDHQRGSSALQVTDPTTQSQTGSLGILYNYLLIALFFSLGGPFLFFDGLASSYQMIPVDSFLNMAFFNAKIPFWKQVFQIVQLMFRFSVQFAAPALAAILITDMFLGIANRLAPQVQIVFLGISLKSWVGLAILTAAWSLILTALSKEAIQWFKMINQLIEQVGRGYAQN